MTTTGGPGGLLAGMDQERDEQAVADFKREREAVLEMKCRPRRLPPGNRSVQAIVALEMALNEGQRLSTLETDWQFTRRVFGA